MRITSRALYGLSREAERAVAEQGPYDLVLIDAPQSYFGREEPLRVAHPYLSPGALVLLDDAGRNGECWVMWRWLANWPGLELIAFQPAFPRLGIAVLRHSGDTRVLRSTRVLLARAHHNLILAARLWIRALRRGEPRAKMLRL